MRETRVIPVLLLDDRELVKTISFKDGNYIGDPLNAIKLFNEFGADEICILDINASRQGTGVDYEFIEEMSTEAFMPVSYGGGITCVEEARVILSNGCEKVVVNTALFENKTLLHDLAEVFGRSSVVAGINHGSDWLGSRWAMCNAKRKKRKVSIVDLVNEYQELGAGEIFLNSVDRDGHMVGYDLKLISELQAVMKVPLIACGGAGSLQDFRLAVDAGADAVAGGSVFVYRSDARGVLVNYPTDQHLSNLP